MQRLDKNLAKTFEHSNANPPLYVTIGIGYPEFLDFHPTYGYYTTRCTVLGNFTPIND